MAKRWQKDELAYLKQNGGAQSLGTLATRFETEESEVLAKLQELGITPVSSNAEAARSYGDATSASWLAGGLEQLQRGQWQKAAELFGRVIADDDGPMAARARQFLAVCRQREAAANKAAESVDQDSFLEAVFHRNRGNLEAALEAARRAGRDKKDARHAYLVAAILAAGSRLDEAAAALTLAIELDPKNRIHAFHDADFAELRRSSEHRSLFELP